MLNREAWLNKAIEELRPLFEESEVKWPDGVAMRASVGWPVRGALSKTKRRIGECHPMESSKDSVNEIFISPWVSDPVEVLATEIHEIVHAIDNCKSGHRGFFSKSIRKLGLEGKVTDTHAGDKLTARLNVIIQRLGEYPHATLDPATLDRKKQSTRMIKIACPSCGYTARTTRQWIEVGLPVCPCKTPMEVSQ